MPRRTRKQLIGKKEDRLRREWEREMEVLAVLLRREWHWLSRPLIRRDAA